VDVVEVCEIIVVPVLNVLVFQRINPDRGFLAEVVVLRLHVGRERRGLSSLGGRWL
jgi:hypothetical protein